MRSIDDLEVDGLGASCCAAGPERAARRDRHGTITDDRRIRASLPA